MTAEEFVARLSYAKPIQNGTGWIARCPAHEDHSPSLTVDDGEKGLILHCFAGCPYVEILGAVGLSVQDLWNDTAPLPQRRIVATYDYHDADGAMRYQVVRYQPKDFRQRRPHPTDAGQWLWTLEGVQRVLYRFPVVMHAQCVYVVEGEKDADRLVQYGLCATTNVGGAGKWREEYTQVLAGKDVVLLPDNDAVGIKHMHKVAQSLKNVAASCITVHLPVQPKGDVSDFLDDVKDIAELHALVEQARIQPSHTSMHQASTHLRGDKQGRPYPDAGNFEIIFSQHSPWKDGLWYDIFAERYMFDDAVIDDAFVTGVAAWCGHTLSMSVRSEEQLRRCLFAACKRKPRDPLADYVQGLVWDGQERLTTWLTTYCQAPDTPTMRWAGQALCCAMVARALTPGCQQRYLFILEGPENGGKSKLCSILGHPWATAITAGFDTKDGQMLLRGRWIMEVEELNAMRRAEENHVKGFVTRTEDTYIPKYANLSVTYPRRTVLIGTVNPQPEGFLRGTREDEDTRYVLIRVGQIDLDALTRLRNQLLAEAKVLVENDAKWWHLSPGISAGLIAEREEHRELLVYANMIGEWLENGRHQHLDYTTIEEVMHSALRIEDNAKWAQKSLQMEVAKTLRTLGWVRKKRRLPGLTRTIWTWEKDVPISGR